MNQTAGDLTVELANAERRAYHHFYEDGLAEIVAGIIFALLGLLFVLEASAPPGSALAGISALGLPLIVIGGIYFGRYLVRRLKERITYPRTGYATFRRASKGRRPWVAGVVAAGMGALIAMLFARAPASLAWIPALDGIIIGAFLAFTAWRIDVPRFYGLAAFSALLGATITLRGVDETLGSALYFGGMGTALILVGGWVLAAYLRHTTPVGEEVKA